MLSDPVMAVALAFADGSKDEKDGYSIVVVQATGHHTGQAFSLPTVKASPVGYQHVPQVTPFTLYMQDATVAIVQKMQKLMTDKDACVMQVEASGKKFLLAEEKVRVKVSGCPPQSSWTSGLKPAHCHAAFLCTPWKAASCA